ncbi:MAG: hypothetical protein H8E70_07290 [Candidatus Marinimicrobia bacterium]|nr:hypothetical protein [Candidatus Neomarinimicrobiota bacterium]
MKIQEYKSCLIAWALWISAFVNAEDSLNPAKVNSIYMDHGLSFNGDGYVVVQDHESLSLDGDFTIEFWLKPDSLKRYTHILNKHQPGINNDGSWVLKSIIDPSRNLSFAFSWPYIPYEIHTNVEKTFHKNDWFHFAFCYLKSKKYYSFWFNGNLINEGFAEININDTEWPLYIGSEISYNYFKGLIAEIRLSDIVRYTSSFRSQASFHSDQNTLAYWPCNEGQGDILHDLGPYENHGKLNNVYWLNPTAANNNTLYLFLFLLFISIGTFVVINKRKNDKRTSQTSISSKNAFNTDQKYAVEIRVFDHFQLRIDGKEIHHSDWGSKKARSLFIYILLNNHRGVTPEKIAVDFWPDVDHKSAVNSRNVALSKIRVVLGEYAYLMQRTDDLIKIVPDENTFCDFSLFSNVNGNGKMEETSLSTAVQLYGMHGLLPEMYEPWADIVRDQANAKAHFYASKLGTLYMNNKEWEKLTAVGEQMLSWSKLDEIAIKYAVKGLKEQGNASRAKMVYNQFKKTYNAELGEPYKTSFEGLIT